MNLIGNITAIAVLMCMMIQDFRSRSISAYLLPAIIVCMLIPPFSTAEYNNLLFPNFTCNIILLTVQFILLWLFVSLKNKQWTQIINTQIGLGDILLLVCLTPFFSPLNFFVLFVLAIVFSLIVTLLVRSVRGAKSDFIPFAGLLAVPLIILCALRIFFPVYVSFSSDDWLQLVLNP
jgi:hypothetical protein